MISEPDSTDTESRGQEPPTPPKPSSSIGTALPPNLRRALSQVNHRTAHLKAEQTHDEPMSVGEILQNQMFQSPTRLRRPGVSADERRIALWRHANVPRRHYENIRDDSNAPREWIATRDLVLGKIGAGFLYAMIGSRGTGKTQISVQAIVKATACERSALYVKAMDVFLWVRSGKVKDATRSEMDLIAEFLSPQLLIIDELGERGETEFEDRLLVYLIDRRYDVMHDTILIANLTEPEFRASMGPSISDRLHECGGAIVCDWPSFRRGDSNTTTKDSPP